MKHKPQRMQTSTKQLAYKCNKGCGCKFREACYDYANHSAADKEMSRSGDQTADTAHRESKQILLAYLVGTSDAVSMSQSKSQSSRSFFLHCNSRAQMQAPH